MAVQPVEPAKRMISHGCRVAATRLFLYGEKIHALRVLVVDDEPLIRWSLVETLSDRGHQTVEAGDARSALAAVSGAAIPFDVVLLDFRLPDSNDLTLLSELRRLTPSTQIILMTAFGTADVVRGAIELGAFRVVGKPFEVHELASLVQEAHSARPA